MCTRFSSFATHTSDLQPTDLLTIAVVSARSKRLGTASIIWAGFKPKISKYYLDTLMPYELSTFLKLSCMSVFVAVCTTTHHFLVTISQMNSFVPSYNVQNSQYWLMISWQEQVRRVFISAKQNMYVLHGHDNSNISLVLSDHPLLWQPIASSGNQYSDTGTRISLLRDSVKFQQYW